MFTFKNTFAINFIYILKYISKYLKSHWNEKTSVQFVLDHYKIKILLLLYFNSPPLCYVLHKHVSKQNTLNSP